MNEPLKVILDFVEGRLSGKDFEQSVYNDAALESLLKSPALRWHDTYIKTNPYDYLLTLNFDDAIRGVLNAQGAMEMFLEKSGVAFKRTTVYSDFHGLLLDSQPRWLDVDPTYLQEQILPEAGDLKGRALKEWLKVKLRDLFRFHKKPPRWIQNPAWPINGNGPLYFLGQLKIEDCELFHDDGAAYVFVDTKTGTTQTVLQLF